MNNLDRLVIGGLVLVGAMGFASTGKTYKTGCETYQGYRDVSGDRYFVFDEKIEKDRENGPNFSLVGYHEMANDLEIGKKYITEVMEPRLSMFPKRMTSFESCD